MAAIFGTAKLVIGTIQWTSAKDELGNEFLNIIQQDEMGNVDGTMMEYAEGMKFLLTCINKGMVRMDWKTFVW